MENLSNNRFTTKAPSAGDLFFNSRDLHHLDSGVMSMGEIRS